MKTTSSLLLTILVVSVCLAQIPTAGLVAHYPFSGNANDASGNGHNGIVSGAVLSQDRFGNNNSAYSFDGTDRSVIMDIGVHGTLSVSLWFKTVQPTRYYPTIMEYSSSDGFAINILGTHPAYVSSGRTGRVGAMGQLELESPSVPAYDEWHHVVLVRDTFSDTAKLYLDGVLVAAKFNTNTLGDPPGTVYIGRATSANPGGATNAGFFTGSIDDIGFYGKALTATEVSSLYRRENQITHSHSSNVPKGVLPAASFLVKNRMVLISTNQPSTIILNDIAGRCIFTRKIQAPGSYSLPTGIVSKGTYILRMISAGFIDNARVTIF